MSNAHFQTVNDATLRGSHASKKVLNSSRSKQESCSRSGAKRAVSVKQLLREFEALVGPRVVWVPSNESRVNGELLPLKRGRHNFQALDPRS